MTSFLQPSYWLTMSPPEVGGLIGTVVFILFIAFFVLGTVGRIVADRKGGSRLMLDVANRLSTLFVTMGIIGLCLFLFSFEEIELFGARFWYPVWFMVVLVWAFMIYRYATHEVPTKQKRAQELEARSKYLPKAHSKKKRRR